MTLLERVARAKQVWDLLLPACAPPDDCQFARWVSRFHDDEIDWAFTRVAGKKAKGFLPDSDSAYKYATGVMVNERKASEVGNA